MGLFGRGDPSPAPSGLDDGRFPPAVAILPLTVFSPDFADFAGPPTPAPPAGVSTAASDGGQLPPAAAVSLDAASTTPGPGAAAAVSYTKWYRVWERTSASEFRQEMYILPFLVLLVVVHVWGARINRRKAHGWMRAHAPVLRHEFAQVGYAAPGVAGPTADDVIALGLRQAMEGAKNKAAAAAATTTTTAELLREKKMDEFTTYATGRLNVAFADFKLCLAKRYNPLLGVGEIVFSTFFESMTVTVERMEATLYVFDGREAQLAPDHGRSDDDKGSAPSSTFDGFVWAVLHKDLMRTLREDRYDLSLTSTRDHPQLPVWATVMTESAEITDMLLTPELVKAMHEAGDAFQSLIISDQPSAHPST